MAAQRKAPAKKKGGKRTGAGRPKGSLTTAGGRAWARKVVDSAKVRAMLARKAETDPMVALKLFEHGYGRPPQSLDVKHAGDITVVTHISRLPGEAGAKE